MDDVPYRGWTDIPGITIAHALQIVLSGAYSVQWIRILNSGLDWNGLLDWPLTSKSPQRVTLSCKACSRKTRILFTILTFWDKFEVKGQSSSLFTDSMLALGGRSFKQVWRKSRLNWGISGQSIVGPLSWDYGIHDNIVLGNSQSVSRSYYH